MQCVELENGAALRVYGPAKLTVERGSLLAAGYAVSAGEELIVRSTRGTTLYAIEASRVCYVVGGSGHVERINDGAPRDWLSALEKLDEVGAKRIVVLGAPDTGKSTFSLWLRNRLSLCFIEADVGQNELGLPAMVAASRYDGVRYPVVNDLRPSRAWFVGHVSADRVPDAIIASVAAASRWCGSYVVDTDGYVLGRGLLFKLNLLRALEPDAVVVMGSEPDPNTVKRFAETIVTVKPPSVRERDRVDRKAYRDRAYAAIFRETVTLVLDIEEVALLNHENCRRVPVDGEAMLLCGERVYVTGRRLLDKAGSAILLRRGWERGLLIGFDSQALGEAPGILHSIDYARGRIVIEVPKSMVNGKPSYVVLGFVRLNVESHVEIEKIDPGLYPTAIVRSTAARGKSR